MLCRNTRGRGVVATTGGSGGDGLLGRDGAVASGEVVASGRGGGLKKTSRCARSDVRCRGDGD